jgi:hypothetical protein
MVCRRLLNGPSVILFGTSSLGQIIKIIRPPQMEVVVNRLIELSSGKDDELRDISTLGMVHIPVCVHMILLT